MTKPVDPEMDQFQSDLLQSVRQMKAGKAARTSVVPLTPVFETRSEVIRELESRAAWRDAHPNQGKSLAQIAQSLGLCL